VPFRWSVERSGVTRSTLSRFTRLDDDMGVVGGGEWFWEWVGSVFPGLLKAGEVDVERCLFAAVVGEEGDEGG
jgi:hypothetical protein